MRRPVTEQVARVEGIPDGHVVSGFSRTVVALFCLVTPAFAQTPPPMEAVTLEQAVERAIKNNPTVAQAAQGILRAEGLLQQARAATMPFVTANLSTSGEQHRAPVRRRDYQPRTQATLSAQLGMPVLAASRWAATAQARDQVEIANLSTADVRTNIAVATAQAYLAIIAQKRQVEVTQTRARDVAGAPRLRATASRSRGRHPAQRAARRSGSRHERGEPRDGPAWRSPRAGGARRVDCREWPGRCGSRTQLRHP